jgi:hypothetical protein
MTGGLVASILFLAGCANPERGADMQARATDAFTPVAALAASLERGDFADSGAFHRFALAFAGKYPVTILSWAPLVKNAERDGKLILRPTPDDRLIPQEERDDYLPVLYQERFDGNALTLGFDLQALPDRKAVIDRARDSRNPIAIQPPKAAFKATAMPVYSILWPVFRDGAFIGVVAGLAPADKMLDFATAGVDLQTSLAVFSRHGDDLEQDVPVMLRRAGSKDFEIGVAPLGPPAAGSHRAVRSFAVHGLEWLAVFDFRQ